MKFLNLFKKEKKPNLDLELIKANIFPDAERIESPAPAQLTPLLTSPHFKHNKKIKRCYVAFLPSKAVGMLIKPYYEFLPGDKVKLYWLHINSERREKMTTVLPRDVVFYKGSLFLIGDYQFIPILTYDMFGNKVEFAPFMQRIIELEALVRDLREKIRTLEAEKKAMLKPITTQIYEVAELIEQLRRSVQLPGQSFYLEETKKIEEGENEGY